MRHVADLSVYTAGRAERSAKRELRAHLLDTARQLDRLDHGALGAIMAALKMPPIRGGAIDLIAGLAQQTGNVGVTTAAANIFGANPTALSPGAGQYLPQLPDPWGLAIAFTGQVTGVAAGASITVAIVNQAGTQIGSALDVNQGAGAATVGSIVTFAPLRGTAAGIAATTGINATVIASSGTGTMTHSATSPGVLVAVSFLS